MFIAVDFMQFSPKIIPGPGARENSCENMAKTSEINFVCERIITDRVQLRSLAIIVIAYRPSLKKIPLGECFFLSNICRK